MGRSPLSDEQVAALPYRPCVGIMLVNADGRVFVARRADTDGEDWQMPQGGIDKGEAPADAALRELAEEVGTDKAVIVAESADWLSYDLPRELIGVVWKGRWRGQTQKWFAMRFTGADTDIRLDAHEQEFDAWRWADLNEVPGLIVPFKRPVYEAVVREFEPAVRAIASDAREE
jgi:putative (di)nucleoside polyphosphate hydrolase